MSLGTVGGVDIMENFRRSASRRLHAERDELAAQVQGLTKALAIVGASASAEAREARLEAARLRDDALDRLTATENVMSDRDCAKATLSRVLEEAGYALNALESDADCRVLRIDALAAVKDLATHAQNFKLRAEVAEKEVAAMRAQTMKRKARKERK